jgi:hypothetical protein
LQKGTQNNIYDLCKGLVPSNILSRKNKARTWMYGYNEKYDIVVISKDGTIGEIIHVSGLRIALPAAPKTVFKRSEKKDEQYWEVKEIPTVLKRISTIFQWHEAPSNFKNQWIDYIEEEFNRREQGFWFMNNGVPTYITGTHYMYLQWTKIDVGHPDFREANRIFYLFWEACKADKRSFGMCYLKIRRSGFSFMSSCEGVNTGTITKNARIGILSKTGSDAKKMFTDKIVPISNNYPFFFKPIQDGMDKPKTELAYRVPASKITKKNMFNVEEEVLEGLDTTIDWKNTSDNSYDGEKLQLLIHDESGKWEKPENILNNWRVTKTCLRLGSKVIGKCMMGSTSNALDKGGRNFKNLYNDSNCEVRNANGQTKSGLYSLFVPMEWNMEGFIDRYGMPVLENPKQEVVGIDNEYIYQGAVNYWENEVVSLKHDPDAYGSLHGLTKFNMDDAPSNEFFLEYIARPQTAEIFFEEVLMACVFYGMPILCENNKPRLLYHFKNRGYRGYCLNRPDKKYNKLSKTERELGGIPNSSEDVKQSHASAIESYIEKHIGLDLDGTYRDKDVMGSMYFQRTLEDWAKFDINNRTRFDASISSGLAIMSNQKHLYTPVQKQSKISINFARYNNKSSVSQLLKR